MLDAWLHLDGLVCSNLAPLSAFPSLMAWQAAIGATFVATLTNHSRPRLGCQSASALIEAASTRTKLQQTIKLAYTRCGSTRVRKGNILCKLLGILDLLLVQRLIKRGHGVIRERLLKLGGQPTASPELGAHHLNDMSKLVFERQQVMW